MGTNGAGYKYIRAEFSAALAELSPSSIEIRAKKDNQLYSVDTVDLSSDGKSADITLFGSLDDGGTTFLQAGEIYILTITDGDDVESFEFQLPDNRSNLTVTSVDLDKNTITTRSNGTSDPSNGGKFNVGDIYEENLGQLLGRTISVGVDANNALMSLYVYDEDVVYAQVTYNYGKDKEYYTSDDYFETAAGDKYYFEDTATKSIAVTRCYEASTGDREYPAQDDETDLDVYKYAKLVLNSNGTIAAAMLEGQVDWDGHIMTTSTDGTRVIESSALALDFNNYMIIKDGDIIEVDDLEEGDVLYYNSTSKFVDVYAEEVVGQLSDLTDEKICVDGTAYKWGGAQYLKDKKYKTLTKANLDDMKYLNSLDKDVDTTVLLNRKGDIAYIYGTVIDNSVTKDTVYALTADGSFYNIGTHYYLELPVSDGESSTVLRVDVSELTKWNGLKAEISDDAAGGTASDGLFDVEYDDADADAATMTDLVGLTPGTDVLVAKDLIVVTRDQDGNIIGIKAPNAAGNILKKSDAIAIHSFAADDQVLNTDDINSWKLSKSTTIIPEAAGATIAAGTNYTVSTSSPVYILSKPDNKVIAKKTTVGELTTVAKSANIKGYVEAGKTAIKWIVIDNTNDDAWAEGDTEEIGGIIKDITIGLNQTTQEKEVESVILLTVDGEVVIDGDEVGKTITNDTNNVVAAIAKGQYRVFNVVKDTTDLSSIADTDRFTYATLAAGRAYDDSKLTLGAGAGTVVLDSNYKVYVYTPSNDKYTETTIGTINTDRLNEYKIAFHATTHDASNNYTADVVVVTKLAAPNFELADEDDDPVDMTALAAAGTKTIYIISDKDIDTATATITGTAPTKVSTAAVTDSGSTKIIEVTLTKGTIDYADETSTLTLNYLAGPDYAAGAWTFQVVTEEAKAVPTTVNVSAADCSGKTSTSFKYTIVDQSGNDITSSATATNLTVKTAGATAALTGATINTTTKTISVSHVDVTTNDVSAESPELTLLVTSDNIQRLVTFTFAYNAAGTTVTITPTVTTPA